MVNFVEQLDIDVRLANNKYVIDKLHNVIFTHAIFIQAIHFYSE